METEIVGWLADREEATRAYANTLPPTPAHKCRRNCGGDDGSRLHRGTAFWVGRANRSTVNKSTTSAEIFAASLCVTFAALLEKEIFENEPPFLPL